MLNSLGIHFDYMLEDITDKFFEITIFLTDSLPLDVIVFKTKVDFPHNSAVCVVHYFVALVKNQTFNNVCYGCIIQSTIDQFSGIGSPFLSFCITRNFDRLPIQNVQNVRFPYFI